LVLLQEFITTHGHLNVKQHYLLKFYFYMIYESVSFFFFLAARYDMAFAWHNSMM